MTAAVLAVGTTTASAATWSEGLDAGDLPATAQSPSGTGALTTISGVLPSTDDNDVDMYRICITDPGAFSAKTAGTITDPQLFLFDSAGLGVEARDDIVEATARQSDLTAGNPHSPTSPGIYHLAVSRWDNDALSSGGLIFPGGTIGDGTAGMVVGPTGPGGGSPVSAWTGNGDAANEDGGTSYSIALTGTAFCMTFEGFFSPIDNEAVNIARAGQAIPVKYRLLAADGTPVSDPSSFVSVTSQTNGSIACAGLPTDALETYSGTSGLQYLGDGYWQFNWKTPKSYAKQCRTMTLTLSDGSAHTAAFQFT